MKLFRVVLALSFSGLLMTGCSDKFNVAAPYENITVVDGFLDQADTAHYIRIEKAFLDNNKSAVAMAQVPDSLYFPQLNVMIERLDANYNLFDTIHLTKVDLNQEGYPKQTGAFANSPNWAYKFKNLLDPNYFYRIVITNPLSGAVDSAITPALADIDPLVFAVDILNDSDARTNKLNFASTLPNSVLTIDGSYNPPAGITINPVGILQAILRFNWIDSNGTNGVETPRYYDFDMGYTTISSGNNFQFAVANPLLYSALATGMGAAPSGIYRLIGRCQLYVYMSTNDFNAYLNVANSAGTGLTGDQIEPTWTNISGSHVLGLFTARGSRNGYVTIGVETVDSLRVSTIVNPLCNLVGTTY